MQHSGHGGDSPTKDVAPVKKLEQHLGDASFVVLVARSEACGTVADRRENRRSGRP
jgi:hypothetical protein